MCWVARVAKSMSKLISGDGVAEYKRWQIPDVAPGGRDAGRGPNKYLTAVQLERIQKQAYEEAYARGLREGTAAGQAQIKEKARLFIRLANLLERPLKDSDDRLEQELLQLCLAVARQIIRREITLDSGHIIAVIREALSALPMYSQKMRIRLHPEDADRVRSYLSESGEDISWQIVEDPALTRGDCKVVTEFSQVDASLDKRLGAIAAKIMGGERKDDQDDV